VPTKYFQVEPVGKMVAALGRKREREKNPEKRDNGFTHKSNGCAWAEAHLTKLILMRQIFQRCMHRNILLGRMGNDIRDKRVVKLIGGICAWSGKPRRQGIFQESCRRARLLKHSALAASGMVDRSTGN
jgi:hypothetical protein